MSYEAPIHEAKALPVSTGKLVGRETALKQVYAGLKAGHPVLIHGPVGVGKTALAATLAGAYTQQPGGVPPLEELLVRVGRAYNVEEITHSDNPVGMIGAVENTLKSNKPFLVIDGEIEADVASRFVSRCVNGLPVLVATEQKLDGAWAVLGLDKLDAEQAAELFRREARMTADDENIFELTRLVGYLPLGIIVAARAMIASKQTPATYVKLMQQIAQASGGSSPTNAFIVSFRSLTEPLQGLVLYLGATLTGKGSPSFMSVLSGAPEDSVAKAMGILSQLYLVSRIQRGGKPYYQMHPTVYQFARTWLRNSNRLNGLQSKVLDAVLDFARQSDAAIEMENVMVTAQWAADQDNRTFVSDLVDILETKGFFEDHRYEQKRLRTLAGSSATAFPAYTDTPPEEALPLPEDDFPDDEIEDDEDEALADEVLEATFISNVFDETDDADVAVPVSEAVDLSSRDITQLRTALAQFRQAGDGPKQIEVLKAIGDLQVEEGMENEAIATYAELLTIYEELDDKTGILETLDMLSALMAKTENYQAAIMHASRGVKLAQEMDEPESRMQMFVTLGDSREQLGESEQSDVDYSAALEIARQRDDKQNEAIILYKLGFAQLDNGEPENAIDTWEQCLALFKAQEKRDYEGRTLGGLGSAYGELGRWAEAVNFHTSALYIARETGDREEEGLQLSSLAYAATQSGQLGEAVLRYRQALHLAYVSDNVDNIVSVIVELARLLLQSRRHITVAELLIDDALNYEPNDRDVRQLKERIQSEKMLAESHNTPMIDVGSGTAEDYAENAYALLDG
jgi:tetratricopeptide (TPR) repeat protein/energy-coupling factor transporter ATP-binding protein EcfA2